MPLFACSGQRPTNLGVKDGTLAPCSSSPNCVSSQASDTDHRVDPLVYRGQPADGIERLKGVLQTMEQAEIITETDDYLYAEFTSGLMGFVDDVEFFLDPGAQIIHVRSASRLGHSDLGANRARVDAIRARFNQL